VPRSGVIGGIAAAIAGVAISVGAGVQRSVDRAVGRRRPEDLLVDPDGFMLHVVRPPKSAGRPVVFAETGLGGTGADWESVSEFLDQSAALWVPDRPGLGWSDFRPDGDAGIPGAIARLEVMRAAAGVQEPTVIAGWSLGALLAVGVASVRPDLVAGLVLVDPSHPDEARKFSDPSANPIGQFGLMVAGRLSTLGGAAAVGVPGRRYLLRTGARTGRSVPADTVTFATARSGRAILEELARFSDRCNEVAAAIAANGLPDIPCHVLTASDRAVAERADEWAEMHRDLVSWFPQGELTNVSGSGHNMVLDRPDAVADAITAMITLVASRPSE